MTTDPSNSPAVADQADSPEPPPDLAQRRSSRWHKAILWSMGVAVVGYLVVLPVTLHLIDSWWPQPIVKALEDRTLVEAVRVQALHGLTGLWFLVLGGTIGSFLNVVAYRMPRKESVIFRPSHCPKCDSRILGQDNIPILGWLKLGGRCRSCHAPISARYPIVEAISSGFFFLLFVVQLISGSANIPLRTPPADAGIVSILFFIKWEHLLLYLYHVLLFSSLLVWVLVDIDRQTITRLAKIVTTELLVLPVLVWPQLLPVPAVPQAWFSTDVAWQQALLTGAIGGAVGCAVGQLITRVLKFWQDQSTWQEALYDTGHFVSALGIVGLSLGWQAVLMIALLTLCLRLVGGGLIKLGRWRLPPWTTWLLIAFLLHHLLWRWAFDNLTTKWLGTESSVAAWCLMPAFLFTLALCNGRFGTKPAKQPAL